MRFVHRIENIDYVVRPSQIQFSPLGTRMPPTPSVNAKFRKHLFDSKVAQAHERWSDETRKDVESYLMAHGDFNGGGLYVEDMAPEGLNATPEQLHAGLACVATTTAPDGSVAMCGKRPVVRDDMCAEHVAMFLPAETEQETEPEAEEFACEDCGRSFDKAQGLRMHRMKVHPVTTSPAAEGSPSEAAV